MRRNSFYIGVIFLLLIITAATPISVRAEGDPPTTPEPVQAPWITGRNPQVSLTINEDEELSPAGAALQRQSIAVQLMAPPSYVELESQSAGNPAMDGMTLAVPQIYQKPEDVTCGAAALGMALEFLSLNGEGIAPSQDALVNQLRNSGLLYKTGTGVEELAYMARQHGYQGTTAFHDWSLEQLAQQLAAGRPVVVSLGSNGDNQPGHFVTLTGISEDGKWVSYNDPTLGKQTVPAADFMKSWNLQGNSGLSVQKEPLSAMNDPMLPWMGLFSAMAMLAVMAKQVPLGNEITKKMEDMRTFLSNPHRKGSGGKLTSEGGSSSAPEGYKWVPTTVAKYGWKNVTITEKVEVPNLVKTWAIVKVNRWIEKVPVYKTVKVDKGHWAYRTITKYRTERIRTKQRYKTKKYYWYRQNGRLRRGSYYVWKTRTVVKTRKVPYTKREKYWVPKIVTEKRLDYYRTIEHRDPVYGWRTEKKGTKIVEQPKITKVWGKVGTETKWKLEKVPVSVSTAATLKFKEEKLLQNQTEERGVQQSKSPDDGDPVLEPVPRFFKDPQGWAWANIVNAGRQSRLVENIIVNEANKMENFNNVVGEKVRENTSPADAAFLTFTLATPFPGDEEVAAGYITAKVLLSLGLSALVTNFAGKQYTPTNKTNYAQQKQDTYKYIQEQQKPPDIEPEKPPFDGKFIAGTKEGIKILAGMLANAPPWQKAIAIITAIPVITMRLFKHVSDKVKPDSYSPVSGLSAPETPSPTTRPLTTTPTPTETLTPTPTPTDTPTSTPSPTFTPLPTETLTPSPSSTNMPATMEPALSTQTSD